MVTNIRALIFLWILATPALAVPYPIGVNPTPIVTAGDMSAATITSDPIPIFGIDNINVQCVWTGTPAGTFTVEVSLDATHWTALAISPALIGGGAAGNFDIDLNQQGAAYFHLIYTKSGSTGVLNCLAYGKKV